METEEFAFDFTHQAVTYSVQVKRFPVDEELHLWTLVRRPRADERDIYLLRGSHPRADVVAFP